MAEQTDISALVKVIASWYLFLEKVVCEKFSFDYIDSKWDEASLKLVKNNKIDIDLFLNHADFFQEIPDKYPNFINKVKEAVNSLRTN